MTAASTATRPPLSAGLGAASALSVVLIWAAWLISTRHSVGTSLSPLDLSLLRYGVPALLLSPYWLRTGLWPKGMPKWTLVLMVCGSGAPFFQLVGFGMKATPASAAGVLLPGIMPLAPDRPALRDPGAQRLRDARLPASAPGHRRGLRDRKSTRLNSSHRLTSRMPSSA
jgi:hypothetical protein